MTLAQFPPIPGQEELRYDPTVVRLGLVPQDARLVFETRGRQVRLRADGPLEAALAWDLERPFEAWPPAVSTCEASTDSRSFAGPIEAATWPDGCALALSMDGEARWIPRDEAEGDGARHAPRDIENAPFVCTLRDGFDLVLERSEGGDGAGIGYLPLSARYARGAVGHDGALWLAFAERRDPSVVDVFHVDRSVQCLGSMPCPAMKEMLQLEGVLERTGGAWLLYQNRYSLCARAVDRSGFGIEWTTRWAVMGNDSVRFARLGDGLVVAVVQSLLIFNPDSERRLLLIATDGERATRALGFPTGDAPLARPTAVTVAPDGSSVLVAYLTATGLAVTRAAFSGSGAPEDPWAGDAAAIARAQAAQPPAPEDEDEEEDLSEPLFDAEARPTCQEVIERLRETALATAVFVMAHPSLDEDAYRGDRRRGSYLISNGQGDFMVFAWSEKGLVATAFEHETSEDSDLPYEERRPLRFFGRIPRGLVAVAKRAVALTDHSVTGGLWMTDRGGRRGGDLMSLLDHIQPSRGSAPVVESAWDATFERLRAATTKTTLTEEDVMALLRAGEAEAQRFGRPSPLTLEGVKLGAKKLAKLEILWLDPRGDLERFRARPAR